MDSRAAGWYTLIDQVLVLIIVPYQNAFESALLSAPMILAVAGNEQMQKEKETRWNYISRAVEGKNRNQCLSRYRLLAQMVLDKKQGEAVMTSASVSTNA